MQSILRLAMVLVVLVLATTLLISWAFAPDFGKLEAIHALPEASLPPPAGAIEVRQSERPRQWRGVINGWEYAYLKTTYGTDQDFADVLRYYAKALAAAGWSTENEAQLGEFLKGPFVIVVYDITTRTPLNPPKEYRVVYVVEINNFDGTPSEP